MVLSSFSPVFLSLAWALRGVCDGSTGYMGGIPRRIQCMKMCLEWRTKHHDAWVENDNEIKFASLIASFSASACMYTCKHNSFNLNQDPLSGVHTYCMIVRTRWASTPQHTIDQPSTMGRVSGACRSGYGSSHAAVAETSTGRQIAGNEG